MSNSMRIPIQKGYIDHLGSILDELISSHSLESHFSVDFVSVVPTFLSSHECSLAQSTDSDILVYNDESPYVKVIVVYTDHPATSSYQILLHDVHDHPLSLSLLSDWRSYLWRSYTSSSIIKFLYVCQFCFSH